MFVPEESVTMMSIYPASGCWLICLGLPQGGDHVSVSLETRTDDHRAWISNRVEYVRNLFRVL